VALLNRPQHACQHGVRLGAAFGSIAAAHLARDRGRTQGVFGTPVGGVNGIGFEEKGKYGREFDGQMRRESAGDSGGPGVIDERVELVFQMPAGNCQPRRRHAALLVPIADVERVLEDALDLRREAR
jgi:hypothetical protein